MVENIYNQIRFMKDVEKELRNRVESPEGIVNVSTVVSEEGNREALYDNRFIYLATNPDFPKIDGTYMRLGKDNVEMLLKVKNENIPTIEKFAKTIGLVVSYG